MQLAAAFLLKITGALISQHLLSQKRAHCSLVNAFATLRLSANLFQEQILPPKTQIYLFYVLFIYYFSFHKKGTPASPLG